MALPFEDAAGITAMLGPTNTGKTHQAILRMLEHPTGVIGLPLRLLAREVYDRLSTQVGERAVALVTGEEKRIPAQPRYWVCTVEAMPVDLAVDFVAVDEIQLSCHPERGHVFTDRLLHARGRKETWFLGSETVRPLICRLVPEARIKRHPRLSVLRGVPPVALNHLPKRSAIVAFSAQRVYEIAERLRRKFGGAALVLGALSPRTRNAQVALYQSGEVDYLVATDAIGMGLNLEISRVVFADLHKFDGRKSRPLELAELAQIAGRAGRYLNDGTFSVLSPLPALSQHVASALEQHRFPHERVAFYRNRALDYASLDALCRSLTAPPGRRELRGIQPAEDHRALLALRQRPEIQRLCQSQGALRCLWDVCQIPDYRQLLFELHVRLLEEVYLQLMSAGGKLASSWLDEHLRRIDRTDGDIETLMGRIASIRTWNYVAGRREWLDDGPGLADRARQIEDRLSDSLHEALLARFVERKITHSVPLSKVTHLDNRAGKSQFFAQLWELSAQRGALVAPQQAAASDATDELVDATHEQFSLDPEGRIRYQERVVATLTPGIDLLHPEVKVRLEPDPGKGARARIQRRLTAFTRDVIEQLLLPLRHRTCSQLSPPARGLLYQLEQGLGTVARATCSDQIESLSQRDRQLLASMGVKFGAQHLFVRSLLTEESLRLRLALASSYYQAERLPFEALVTCNSVAVADTKTVPSFLTAIGFVAVGPLWLRVDAHERRFGRGNPRPKRARRPKAAPTTPHSPADRASLT